MSKTRKVRYRIKVKWPDGRVWSSTLMSTPEEVSASSTRVALGLCDVSWDEDSRYSGRMYRGHIAWGPIGSRGQVEASFPVPEGANANEYCHAFMSGILVGVIEITLIPEREI